VEVDGSGSWTAADAIANNIVRISAEELQRTVQSRSQGK
jgi:hypothetical protein